MKKYSLLFLSGILCITLSALDNPSDAATQAVQKFERPQNDIKILVLIIASDDYPVYKELQKIWCSYMHYDTHHVEAYFIRGNPDLTTDYEIQGDVLWTKTPENLIPGILNKTVFSLEVFLPRIKNEFDYVLRTNLSSFYIFPRLLEYLSSCQRTNFYCAFPGEGFGSGSGFLMSSDTAEMLVQNKEGLVNKSMSLNDDVVIGSFFSTQGVLLIPHQRIDFFDIETWHRFKNMIPAGIFQVRVKNRDDLRLVNDTYIQSQLLAMFYK